jgi:hypothetical protein
METIDRSCHREPVLAAVYARSVDSERQLPAARPDWGPFDARVRRWWSAYAPNTASER